MPEETWTLTQLLVFRLQAREYALPIELVSEVLRMVAITPVPDAPAWLPGVINLRGRVVLVMDLRARLGLPPLTPSLNTPIIVAEADGRMVGLLADAVIEVLTLPDEAIEPPAALAGSAHPISAIARAGDRLILIFDLSRLSALAVRPGYPSE
jgi:purine-binding chemotaxis protein CheW